MNFTQHLQEMLDAQKQAILEAFEQFQIENQKEFAKINGRIDELELSFNNQLQELKDHLTAKSVVPVTVLESSEEKTTNVAVEDQANVALKDAVRKEQIEAETDTKSILITDDRKKIYEIMCLVHDEMTTNNEESLEQDEHLQNIIKIWETDEKNYKLNGYSLRNRNIAIVRALHSEFNEIKGLLDKSNEKLYTTTCEYSEYLIYEEKNLLFSDLNSLLIQVGNTLKYPFMLESMSDDGFIETNAFDRASGNYAKYIALVCFLVQSAQLVVTLNRMVKRKEGKKMSDFFPALV